MSTLKNSWLLMKQSCVVLFKNKKLLLFPLISINPIMILLVFFLAGIFAYSSIKNEKMTSFNSYFLEQLVGEIKEYKNSVPVEKVQTNSEIDSPKNIDTVSNTNNEKTENINSNQTVDKNFSIPFIYLAAIYFISMILLTFFNTAFFNEIIHALNGQPVSIIGGFSFAISKWKSILLWSMLAATVGVILRKIEENFGFIGRFVIGLIGMAWSVAAVFAIPIMIREEQNTNPIDLLKKSGNLIKQKWGEGLIGYIGIEAFGLLFFASFSLVCGLLGVLAYMMEFSHYYFIGIGVFWFIILISVFYIQSIVNSIFKCALYLYASEGVLPLGFDEETVNSVWKIKKKKKD